MPVRSLSWATFAECLPPPLSPFRVRLLSCPIKVKSPKQILKKTKNKAYLLILIITIRPQAITPPTLKVKFCSRRFPPVPKQRQAQPNTTFGVVGPFLTWVHPMLQKQLAKYKISIQIHTTQCQIHTTTHRHLKPRIIKIDYVRGVFSTPFHNLEFN